MIESEISGIFSKNAKQSGNINNLLAVMDNDIGNQLLALEYCIKSDPEIYVNGKIKIGMEYYDRIVLNPLMIEFGDPYDLLNTKANEEIIYPQKPIVNQTIDLLFGIQKYYKNEMYKVKPNSGIEFSDPLLRYDIEERKESNKRLFEIYPFMGINTKNITATIDSNGKLKKSADEKLKALLEKYFGNYKGLKSDYIYEFEENIKKFNGDIASINPNIFLGIKVYPPLGFNPWPENEKAELKKVETLYKFCVEKNIPITAHCSDSGFAYDYSEDYSNPDNWEKVLNSYKNLKINFAHFGGQTSRKWLLIKNNSWHEKIIEYLEKYTNVYTDIACCGISSEYYIELDSEISVKKHIENRILFGSDYMIDLLSIKNYTDYLKEFSNSKFTSIQLKNKMCNINSEKFLNVI